MKLTAHPKGVEGLRPCLRHGILRELCGEDYAGSLGARFIEIELEENRCEENEEGAFA
jgi:hypothetical protein